jgi:hypothetical protein
MVDRARIIGSLTHTETHALGLAAADFANRDVISFGGSPDRFHADTRQLMRENGTSLTNPVAIEAACRRMIDFF